MQQSLVQAEMDDKAANQPLIVKMNAKPLTAAAPAEDGRSAPAFSLHTAQLLQAAATSMNFGLVAAFIAGLYSFADDFIDQLLPDHFFETVVEDSASLMPSYIFIVIYYRRWARGCLAAFHYIVYLEVQRLLGKKGRQRKYRFPMACWRRKHLSLIRRRCRLSLSRKGCCVKHSVTRKFSSRSCRRIRRSSLCCIHFLSASDVHRVLNDFVPQLKLPSNADLTGAPKRALLYYVRIELLLTLLACTALIVFLNAEGLWSLLLLPLVLWWRRSCYSAAGVRLEDGQLTLAQTLFIQVNLFDPAASNRYDAGEPVDWAAAEEAAYAIGACDGQPA